MLRVEGVCKKFQDFSLNQISFTVDQGDYFMLLGPSGAGKSLILETIAGLHKPDSGKIFFQGVDITHIGVRERNFGIVYQDYAVFPHLTVYGNIAYPLRRKGIRGKELHKQVTRFAERVSVAHLLARHPQTLSGGEVQRTALARTLAMEPRILLLDEPLSSVDVKLRSELRSLLRSINSSGQTVIHVTHDYEETLALASHLAVVNGGCIEQVGSVQDIFQNPRSEFAAMFAGVHNFYPASIVESSEHGLTTVRLNDTIAICCYTEGCDGEGFVCFSEESVTLSTEKPHQSALNVFQGRVVEIFPQRFGLMVVVDAGFRVLSKVTWESASHFGFTPGAEVWVSFKASSVRFIPRAS